jgi:glycosyltransferase involved in cell wall biosynthesis
LFPESKADGVDRYGRPVEVIPCCIDKNRFGAIESDGPVSTEQAAIRRKPVFIYVGSLGGWYLTDEMIRFFRDAHKYDSQSFTRILTQRDVQKATSLLSQDLSEKDFSVESAKFTEVPTHLKKADIAISFIKACYSKQSSSPTKIAEYLAAGLPIISNSGVGDLDGLIEGENVGVILKGFSEDDYADALEKIYGLLADPDLQQRCRTVAYKYFDLETVGGPAYRRIYKKLLDSK